MVRAFLVAALVAGCGRIGFAPVPLAEVETSELGGAWGQYADARDPTVPCDTERAELTFADCTHLGEHRRVTVPGLACDGLEVADELDAFAWRCEPVDGGVRLVTDSLKPDRFLRDLIELDRWRANRVRIVRDGDVVAQTPASVWWDNPIVPLPENASGGVVALDQPDTVYVLAETRATAGYEITADGVSVVALGGAALVSEDGRPTSCTIPSEGTETCVIQASGRRYLWIEVGHDVVGGPYPFVVALDGVAMSVVREVRDDGRDIFVDVWLGGARGNRVANVTTRRSIYAVLLEGATGNLVERVAQSNSFSGTVALRGSSGNTLRDIAANHDDGSSVELVDATGNHLSALQLARFEGCGVDMLRSHGNTIVGLRSLDGDGPAVCAQESTGNTFTGFTIGGNGIDLGGGSTNNVVSDGVIAGAFWDDPLYVSGSPANTIAFLTIANSDLAGIVVDLSDDVVLADVAVANITGAGLDVASSANVEIHDLVVTDTGAARVELTAADNSRFHGVLALGAGAACVSTGVQPGLDAACAPINASTATPRAVGDISASLVGPIATDDAANPLDAAGLAMPDYLTPTYQIAAYAEIFAFENRYRQWGRDAAFPAPAARGRCRETLATGSCRIWDFRTRAGDGVLERAAGDVVPLPTPTEAAPCPGYLGGGVTITDRRTPPATFLRHAIEDREDGIGNDDGLCESNEACTAAPNLGAYQGDGVRRACAFIDGAVSGVTMHYFEQTGVP